VADGLARLWDLASRRDLAAHARPAPRRGASGHGQTPPTPCGDHRPPIGYDHGKRGVRGFETHTQVQGRQRHRFVDPRGLILTVVVTAASVHDRDGAQPLLEVLWQPFSRLRRLWADGAYAGDLLAWGWALRPWRKVRREIVQRPTGVKGFPRLPWRWIVARTCGWWGRYRRFAKA
jgi:transposase